MITRRAVVGARRSAVHRLRPLLLGNVPVIPHRLEEDTQHDEVVDHPGDVHERAQWLVESDRQPEHPHHCRNGEQGHGDELRTDQVPVTAVALLDLRLGVPIVISLVECFIVDVLLMGFTLVLCISMLVLNTLPSWRLCLLDWNVA